MGDREPRQREPVPAASDVGVANRDAEIYRKYAPELVRYANSLVGPNDAADIVSAAVLRAFTARGWESVQNPRAYLYRTILNEARSQYRSTMRRLAREARSVDHTATTEIPAVRPDVLEALAQLSVKQRSVAYLTYFEDLDEAAVADRMGIGRGSVRQHLARAKRKLRTILDE